MTDLKKGGTKKIIVLLLTVAGLFLLIVFRDQIKERVFPAKQDASNYQAVFLTNGQVYFGKLKNINKDFLTLREVFYLQQVNPNQPNQDRLQGSATSPPSQEQPQLSLVKLGSELHGPTDELRINRSQILFYETMKNDARVVNAIKEYKPPLK